eukprot:754971-Hanusia_phi.AAC.2
MRLARGDLVPAGKQHAPHHSLRVRDFDGKEGAAGVLEDDVDGLREGHAAEVGGEGDAVDLLGGAAGVLFHPLLAVEHCEGV